jgi:hypothetical protein
MMLATQRPAPAANLLCFRARTLAQAVIDSEDNKGGGVPFLKRQPQYRHGIGAAGNGERQASLGNSF